jgi:hypothetical protein
MIFNIWSFIHNQAGVFYWNINILTNINVKLSTLLKNFLINHI